MSDESPAPTPFIRANVLAVSLAFVLYATGLFVFAVFDSSDFGRSDSTGQSEALIYFALYFAYFAIYLAFAVALTKESAVPVRVVAGLCVAICVALIGLAALWFGFLAGMLVFPLGLLTGDLRAAFGLSLVVVPATGWIVGSAFNSVLFGFSKWQAGDPQVARIKRANAITATACAVVAAYLFVNPPGTALPIPLGWERFTQTMVAGMAGPLLHCAASLAMLFRSLPGEDRRPLEARARVAAAVLMLLALAPLGAAVQITGEQSGHRLWTASGVARALAPSETVQLRRKPSAGSLVRIGDYIVDRRPADLGRGFYSYDWKNESFDGAQFKLGDVGAAGHRIAVTLALSTTSYRGLGYLCDEVVEGVLVPCRVADTDPKIKDDPRVIRVALFNGQASIGRLGRTFVISCRYSTDICRIEFIGPWYQGIRVALVIPKKERDQWAEIVRFAVPEIERTVRRVGDG